MNRREEHMLSLGIRAGSLPVEDSRRIYKLYIELAGGPSWDENAKALTDQDLEKLERAIVEAELKEAMGK